MPKESSAAVVSKLSERSCGVFRIEAANAAGVSATQLSRLAHEGVVERLLPNTYRMVAVEPSSEQRLRAALLWAGDHAAAAGRSAGER
jgi:Transcriptional regulator, AbiEi antitoxin